MRTADVKQLMETSDLKNLIIDSNFYNLSFSHFPSADTHFKIQTTNEFQKANSEEVKQSHFFTIKTHRKNGKEYYLYQID